MPPQTLWTGNPNQAISANQGNLLYDDASTTYDAAVYYDGTSPVGLIQQHTPNPVIWTQPNPL